MLTLKMYKDGATKEAGRFSTKIIEAEEIDVHVLRPAELCSVEGIAEGKSFAYYLAPRGYIPDGMDPIGEFFFEAYITNSQGRTIDTVRFYETPPTKTKVHRIGDDTVDQLKINDNAIKEYRGRIDGKGELIDRIGF